MGSEITLIGLFLGAGLTVKAVMLLLIVFSVVSWSIIFERWLILKRAQKRQLAFEERFWAGADRAQLFDALNARRHALDGLEHVFHAGFQTYQHACRLGVETPQHIELALSGAEQAMGTAIDREQDKLGGRLSFLATVGSVSPYIGLFGTVWGIMHAFVALGGAKQVSLSMVAPGIAEALVATAFGLVAAIPAVMAYNRFVNQADTITSQYGHFVDDLMGLFRKDMLERSLGV